MEEKIKKRVKVIITSLFVFSSIIVSLVFPQKMNFKEVSKAPSSPVPHFPIQKSLFKSKDDYIKEVREKINGIIFYPQEAKRKNLTGTVKVEFTIDSQGKVQNPHIIQSSGFSTLDDATLFFIKAANTVSSLPSPLFIGEKEIKLVMPIKFSLPSSQERHQRILKALQKESKKSSGRISFMKKKNLGIEENRLLSLLNNEDLKTLFSLAKKNSQPLKVAMDQIYLAQIKTKEAFRNLFPALGVEYTSTKGETIVDPYKSKSYGIKMEHILYDHKQRKLSWQREKINVAIARKNYEKIENNLLFEVLKAYYQVYTEKKALEAIEIQVSIRES
ncbi:MAG: hypothetical protein B6D56_07395 [Candidatus Omnitrophica bacterium 4484_70.1]|nr:MAG: hypothetical protein B6D56_07395 [Candidatus Omnitrophica bacterium 4484_70.1]